PNLQPLVQVELVDLEHDGDRRQDAEVQELVEEGIPVPLLQRVVESIVPGVEQNGDADQAQLNRDQSRKQDASRPAILGSKVRNCQPPDDGQRGDESAHGDLRGAWIGAGMAASACATRPLALWLKCPPAGLAAPDP